jgi:asparagine synthase (glutamine-hydrolysing)
VAPLISNRQQDDMCGIVGRLRLADQATPMDPETGRVALARIAHRGPDGHGQWASADGLCWLGHTRLSIIDLASGAQPMRTADDALAITFNGEIYNYRELRAELERDGHVFRTNSDTEVILLGYRAWGGRALVRRLNGLFAFALYDAGMRTLLLARDHAGVKPLFWWSDGRELLFASEMKALLPFPAVRRSLRVNSGGIAQLIVTRTVSRPATLFEGMHRLPEGSTLNVTAGQPPGEPQPYWDLPYAPQPQRESDAIDELERRLAQAVEQQLVADVPVGVQLSGGVDSSLVAALMDKVRRARGDPRPVRSFSIGFDIAEYSELSFARQVATRYHTEHHEIEIGADDFVADFAQLCWYHDEPMGEPSAIPTYYMCREAKQHVTVMLCGEGADERFGGYSKYTFEAWAARLSFLPARLRESALRSLAAAMPFRARRARSILEIAAIPSQARRFASWFGCFDTHYGADVLADDFRRRHGDGGLQAAYEDIMRNCRAAETLERFAYCDSHARLVDDILVKGDRMSMAAGIEARVPFLDPALAAFAGTVPASLKIKGRQRKHILKQVAERYLPANVIHRRKVGFTVPLTRWFTGALAPLVRGLLLSERALGRGYFDPGRLRAMIEGHMSMRIDREQALWILLTLEIWHRLFVDDDGSPDAVARVAQEIEALA